MFVTNAAPSSSIPPAVSSLLTSLPYLSLYMPACARPQWLSIWDPFFRAPSFDSMEKRGFRVSLYVDENGILPGPLLSVRIHYFEWQKQCNFYIMDSVKVHCWCSKGGCGLWQIVLLLQWRLVELVAIKMEVKDGRKWQILPSECNLSFAPDELDAMKVDVLLGMIPSMSRWPRSSVV